MPARDSRAAAPRLMVRSGRRTGCHWEELRGAPSVPKYATDVGVALGVGVAVGIRVGVGLVVPLVTDTLIAEVPILVLELPNAVTDRTWLPFGTVVEFQLWVYGGLDAR